jgi:hypothetical protein
MFFYGPRDNWVKKHLGYQAGLLHSLSPCLLTMARRGQKGAARRNANKGQDQSGPRLLPVPKMVTHRFQRNVIVPVPTVPISGGYPMALSFQLSDVPNASDFTNLFDFYTIDRVDVAIMIGSQALQITSCVDYNDAALPASRAELIERSEAEVMTLAVGNYQAYRRTVIPRVSAEIYQGLTTGYGLGKVGQLIDTQTGAVPFYGLKLWIDPATAGGTTANAFLSLRYHLRCVGAK